MLVQVLAEETKSLSCGSRVFLAWHASHAATHAICRTYLDVFRREVRFCRNRICSSLPVGIMVRHSDRRVHLSRTVRTTLWTASRTIFGKPTLRDEGHLMALPGLPKPFGVWDTFYDAPVRTTLRWASHSVAIACYLR